LLAARSLPDVTQDHAHSPVPSQTARSTHAAYPHGSPLIQLRDVLGTLTTDDDVAELFPSHGQSAAAPWRVALVKVLQLGTQ
jgi:transposase